MSILDIETEPDGDALAPHHFYIGIAISVFGFASVWPYYNLTGASMAFIGICIALDDLIEHMTTLPTPLDMLWRRVIYPLVRRFDS